MRPALDVGLPACTLQAGLPYPQLLSRLGYGVLSQHCQHYWQSQHLRPLQIMSRQDDYAPAFKVSMMNPELALQESATLGSCHKDDKIWLFHMHMAFSANTHPVK